ncbi:hypothetical protein FRB94_006651 [Tulasnella sp. JGI-2019a]|nr:hypothetical protein FRB94_006651 [Tulasnella sp. JGI-2019a]KAG9017725.1 hypothetical protein FRB93_004536 [Tulasnella sp. JGI-2019a]KAG9027875.1 hypothetical protein FRB95_007109 [Tulasnella sp. JGI-2019a]
MDLLPCGGRHPQSSRVHRAALLLIGTIGLIRWTLYYAAQLAGVIVVAVVIQALLPSPLASNATPGRMTSDAQAVFIEMFITSVLVFMLAARKRHSTPFAPVGVGPTLFSMPPVRRCLHRAFNEHRPLLWPYSRLWIPQIPLDLGPFLGGLLATFFYAVLKHIKYWDFNPGQRYPRFHPISAESHPHPS